MQNSRISEKYNIILIVLLFVIPLLAVNVTFFCRAYFNHEFEVKELEKKALHEAEILSAEADFNYQFSILFNKFFDVIKKDSDISFKEKSHFINHLEKNANNIFEYPFPKYSLYVFKKSSNASSELFYSKGDSKGGAKGLCFAFDYLVKINTTSEKKKIKKDKNESFAKKMFGQYTNMETIAKELRGLPANTNNGKNYSFFIWDYFNLDENNIWGCFLFCDELDNISDYGRLLALKNLRLRGQAAGAFLPIYKDYGKPIIPKPLEDSKTFQAWADSVTIQEEKEIEKWLAESMSQGVPLGNYTAFCHLKRGASHIAVVVVKAVKNITWPKWLIFINILLILLLSLILSYGLGFGYWPQISLTTRFILSYILASILPISLLSVASYGYILRYENTSVTNAIFDIQMLLKSIDNKKSALTREYVSAFSKAVNDENLVELIKKNGVESKDVAKYVLNIFEDKSKNFLPVLGIKILDEAGNGAFIGGYASDTIDAEKLLNSFVSGQVEMLRNKIIEEDPEAKKNMLPYKAQKKDEDFANKGYKAMTGTNIYESMNTYLSTPIFRKTGSLNFWHIFEYIRINGKTKYMLFVIWDDKSLDDTIVKKSFDDYAHKHLDLRFAGFKVKGNDIKSKGGATRHGSKKFLNRLNEIVRLVALGNKENTFMEENNILLAMPALNFENMVFVGWIDKTYINLSVFYRKLILILFGIVTIVIIFICSFRSASVFLKPVASLKSALDEVSRGNLNIGLNNVPDDELGLLSDDLAKMINGLREKERLSKLISDQAILALQKDTNLLDDTETFNGVALVSDIRNFTGMSEQYDPVVITELLNEHFAEMAKVISDNGGLIYKFIGDAIEAVFPEKNEYEEPSSVRAFKAGCMMIAKLAAINKRRIDKNLFAYKIGVGLCYGTMFSGSVGSLETRLDYSILGQPLKNAAKYEALTIQNPSFPLVVSNDIADRIASMGFVVKAIDTKNQGLALYTLDLLKNKEAMKQFGLAEDEEDKKQQEAVLKNTEQSENLMQFSLQSLSNKAIRRKNIGLIIFILFLVSIFVTLCMNLIYSADYSSIRTESDKESQRLIVQLKSNEVFKSSFETLCMELYEDLRRALWAKNKTKSDKELAEEIFNKYEKMGRPIPLYCCCLFDKEKGKEKGEGYYLKDFVDKGFSSKSSDLIKEYTLLTIRERKNRDGRKAIMENIIGDSIDLYSMKSVYFRRSAPATIENRDTYLSTDIIYDEKREKILAFVFCAIPTEIQNDYLINYYKALAGKHTLLAFSNNEEWYFSNSFSENEKQYLKQNYNNSNLLSEKGFWVDELKIGKQVWNVYVVKKELLSYYKPGKLFNIIIFISSVLLFIFSAFIIKKLFLSYSDSLVSKLRINIILSTILPLIIVGFVSYLYVNEDYSVNKTEIRFKLNSLLDELESKDFYYHPLCISSLEKAAKNNKLKKNVKKYITSINDKEKKAKLDEIRKYLDEKICGNYYEKFPINHFYSVREVIIVGRGDWVVSKCEDRGNRNTNELTELGKIVSEIVKTVFLKRDESSPQALEKGMLVEELLDTLQSVFGGELTNRIINFPKSLIYTTSSFSTVAIYMVPVPSYYDPDYVVISWIFFNNELLPRACELKNDANGIFLKKHFEAGSKDNKLFCFYSPNINVGEYYFYDDGQLINKKEEHQALKELFFASSWINSSFVPISRTVDLYGTHYLEARQGNIIRDNVYAALASEVPIRREADKYFYLFASVIFLSVIMIIFIAQSTISDLLAPVKILINGAKSAAKEDYKYRTHFNRKDELGALGDSFDKMMKGLEEKQLMNRMVSKTALRVSANVIDVESKKINVVLLYITVPGFDYIMKNTPANMLFSKLRKQIATIAEIVINNGGDIDKIMGEKMLIAFHVGDKKPEDVVALACTVAHEIESSSKTCFNVSVGVNYGQVISGFLGVGEKRDFTIIGDPVNVSARIAVFAEKLVGKRLVVSENINELVKDKIKTEEYGEVALKGKSMPLRVFRII